MDTGWVHTRDCQRMAVYYRSPVFIRAKPTRLNTSHLQPFGGKRTSWWTFCLCSSCVYMTQHILCNWGNQTGLQKWKGRACYLIWTTAPSIQECICLWVSGPQRLETFLFMHIWSKTAKTWNIIFALTVCSLVVAFVCVCVFYFLPQELFFCCLYESCTFKFLFSCIHDVVFCFEKNKDFHLAWTEYADF